MKRPYMARPYTVRCGGCRYFPEKMFPVFGANGDEIGPTIVIVPWGTNGIVAVFVAK